MRIIAGRYKGRNIKTSLDARYRPTQSRIRKSLFDILGPIDGHTFCDLFAGSGIIGFEAASRGADHVTFVENDRKSLHLLSKNIEKFIETDFTIISSDAKSFLHKHSNFDTIFADPPYEYVGLNELVKLGCVKRAKGERFILEARTKAGILEADDTRTYGDTELHFWKL